MEKPPLKSELPLWLLQARVTPPRQANSVVPRPRVLKALSEAVKSPVTVVCAPPGFGKTIALAQWRDSHGDENVRWAWLTIDATDDPESVTRHLALAFHVSGLDVARTQLLVDEPRLSTEVLIRRLQSILGCVERSADRWILILDDVEVSSAVVIAETIGPLLRFLPRNLSVVIATRNASRLELDNARSSGLLGEIGARDLRFRSEEIRAVWARTATQAQIATIERRSGGWPALVRLMREHGSSAEFFEGRILRRLNKRALDLAQHLAVLTDLPVDLAEELCGCTDAEAVLTELAALGIVRSTVGAAPTLMMHPLFREYLSERFLRGDPITALQLRYAAAHAYLRRGLHVQAIQMAVATEDETLIGDIVEACDPLGVWASHGVSRLTQLIRLVPDSVAKSRPRVGYACVIRLIKAGRLKNAGRLFDELSRRHLANEPGMESVEQTICRSLLVIYQGRSVSAEQIALLQHLAARRPTLAAMLRCFSATLQSYAHQHNSEFDDATRTATQAIGYAEEARSPYAAYFMYCDLAMISGVLGKPKAAFDYFHQGDLICQTTVRADERLSLLRDAFKLELEHELTPLNLSSIPRLRNIVLRLPRLEGWLDVFAAAYRTYSEKLLLAGNLRAAHMVLTGGLEHIRAQEIESVATVLIAQRAYLFAISGHSQEAVEELDRLTHGQGAAFVATLRSWREVEAFTEASVAIDLARHTLNGLPMLSQAIEFAEIAGNVRSELRLRRLRISYFCVDGIDRESDVSKCALLETLSGFQRAAVFAAKWAECDLASHSANVAGGRPASRVAFFTPREHAVLRELERGLTDKSIAIALSISAHGVRHHLKRIYAKLNVSGRAEARREAKKLEAADAGIEVAL